MSFASYEFILLFMPMTVLLFWAIQRRQISAALWMLVIASVVFYIAWKPSDLLIVGISIFFNYQAAKLILRGGPRTKLIFGGAITVNLIVLGYFKYLGFALQLSEMIFGERPIDIGAIALPLGISFFTFTQIAYLADCYFKKVPPREHNPRDYILFVSFFPHLIAGPILHHASIIPQFHGLYNKDRSAKIKTGVLMFAIGLCKKVLLADNLANIATPVFKAAETTVLSSLDAWIGTIAYTLQLYLDFSGYSDMAVGAALMVGMHIPFNFFSPYKATSIIDFWRRWHISLSNFLRDYLYISLGGNRHGIGRRYLNIFVTMLLGGIWHGAGINFVVWGALHGGFIVVNHAWRDFVVARRPGIGNGIAYKLLAYMLTMSCVMVGWIFFRAGTVHGAVNMLVAMQPSSIPASIVVSSLSEHLLLIFLSIVLVLLFPNSRQIHDRVLAANAKVNWVGLWFACGATVALCLIFISAESPFLYFQF